MRGAGIYGGMTPDQVIGWQPDPGPPLRDSAVPVPAVPVLGEDVVRVVLGRMGRWAGVPADWWGEDNEVIVFTHDAELACQAADLLARRELLTPYAAIAGAVAVEGPSEMVMTGTGDLEDIAVRPAGPGDRYALLVCRVYPVYPEEVAADSGRPALPRWDVPHHCGEFADHVHTRREPTGRGVAVWLVQECAVCGRLWDVLSEQSSEAVISASVYPVWSVRSCGLCCAGECLATRDCCPCHRELGEG